MIYDKSLQDSILTKVSYTKDNNLNIKDRINYGIRILNNLSTEIESCMPVDEKNSIAIFTVEILKTLVDTLNKSAYSFNHNSLNKIILKFCIKFYHQELIEQFVINKSTDSDLVAIFCILCKKHAKDKNDEKYFKIIDEIYLKLSPDIRDKVDSIFRLKNTDESKIFKETKEYLEIRCIIYFNYFPSLINPIESSIYTDCIVTEKWNDLSILSKNFEVIKSHILYVAYSKKMTINKANKAANLFQYGLKFIKENRLHYAFKVFSELYESKFLKGISLKLLAYINISMCRFEEALHFIIIGIFYFDGNLLISDYFRDLMFLIEGMAGCYTVALRRKVKIAFSIPLSVKDLPIENKLVINEFFRRNKDYYESNRTYLDLVYLHGNRHMDSFEFLDEISKISQLYPECTLLYVYSKEDNKIKFSSFENILESSVLVEDQQRFISKFTSIIQKSNELLKFGTDDAKTWWKIRIELDEELKNLFDNSNACKSSNLAFIFKKKIILILENSLHSVPIELFFPESSCFRVLNIDQLYRRKANNLKTSFFLLDPENNLQNTQKTIRKFIETKDNFTGVIGRSLDSSEIRMIDRFNHFLYFGHGNGVKHYKRENLVNEKIFLFGCNSVRMVYRSYLSSVNGIVKKILSNNNLILGALWTVTDKDLDKLTISILNDEFNGDNWHYLEKHRNKCRLSYINGGAIVIYGLSNDIL